MRLGGFSGQWGSGPTLDRKRELLAREGVVFNSDGRIQEHCKYCFPDESEPPELEEDVLAAAAKKRRTKN